MFHSEIFQTFLHRGHLKNSHDAREIAPSQMAKPVIKNKIFTKS
jgi:hypothetical protein